MSSPFSRPSGPAAHVDRALCVLAHPDDVDFGSAGTVATWTAAGTEVTYCIVTDGDAGGFDETPRDEMGPLRQAEQRAAAAAVGVSDVRFLGLPGRPARADPRPAPRHRPRDPAGPAARVLTSSPERFWDRIGASHPDHMTVGESTLRAVYPDARNPFAFPELLADEGLEAWTVAEVWLGASPRTDHAVDVTDVVEQKFTALAQPREPGRPRARARDVRDRLDAAHRAARTSCPTAGSPRRSTSSTPPEARRVRLCRASWGARDGTDGSAPPCRALLRGGKRRLARTPIGR